MKKIGDVTKKCVNGAAMEAPFHSLLQMVIPKDIVIRRSAGETVSYVDQASSSDDD